MPSPKHIHYSLGLRSRWFDQAARLYDQAFGQKLGVAIRAHDQRIALLERTFNRKFALCAVQGEQLVGLAGFHTHEGSLTDGITADVLLSQLGILRGLWSILVFSFYDRTPETNELVMDGLAVHENCRGQGVGSALLQEILRYARENGFTSVRLDVIDTNPRAQRLYERVGFVPVRVDSFPYLRWLLGFSGSTTLVYYIASNNADDSD